MAGKNAKRASLARRVATGQFVRPAGDSVAFGGRPTDLALSPDSSTLYIKDNRGLVVIDARTWQVRQELRFAVGGGSMHGLAVSPNGAHVYATTAQNGFVEASVDARGMLAWRRQITLPGLNGQGSSHPCGIALSGDETTAYVCLSRNNSLGVIDLAQGKLTKMIPVGIAPWEVVLAPDGASAYVSNWGGRLPKPGEKTALSSGTPTLIDAHGVASSGTVSIVDLQADAHAGSPSASSAGLNAASQADVKAGALQAQEIAQIAVGLHPCGLALSPDGAMLYVANANSDTVSVLNLAGRVVQETISLHVNARQPGGSAPNALALARDGKTLYVANGGLNAIAVIAPGENKGVAGKDGSRNIRQNSRLLGFVPAGWYPAGVAVDALNLYFINIKGIGRQLKSTGKSGWNVLAHEGTANRALLPTPSNLRAYTRQALADAQIANLPRADMGEPQTARPVPVPARTGEPSVFAHVVYIIKENRTYDQVFGDMAQANGDPALCIFGRAITPNQHHLAEQFVLLDNFYCNGVNSADGHSWVTEGNVTDHLEKAFGGFTRSYTFGDDPLTYSASAFLWNDALDHGLTFRNYGEMDYAEPSPRADFRALYRDYQDKTKTLAFTQSIGIENLRAHSCPAYPGWNLGIPDVLRAEAFLKELRQAEQTGDWPHLMTVYLPNDHTSGTRPGAPTPRAQVADNDLALGRVVEGISKSRFWPDTCIFVVEDDPQDGFDHVDGHRSPALVISPYTRRGRVVSAFYNQTSVLHTIERILGLPPMNQMDALAPLMRACFQNTPDYRPYSCLPANIALDEMNPPLAALRGKARYWAQQSALLPLARADQADDGTLNRILWYARKGIATPYPDRFFTDRLPPHPKP